MAGIFVSYRRDDSQGFAGRLADDLSGVLGPERVFRDIEIPVGSDFSDVLHHAISASDALLVVIGRHWATQSKQGYGWRLFEPTDWVRTEIEAAFSQGKHVVPVLVAGASMPAPTTLPESIQRLTRLQAAIVTDRHWDKDIVALANRLRTLCPSLKEDRPIGAAAGDTPADVLRELGGRFIEEVLAGRQPPPAAPRQSFSLARRVARRLGHGVRKWVTLAVTVAVIYIGFRLLGDDATLHQLDQLEARLAIGWERLRRYLEGAWK